jgi:uncharacterized protein YutE (UPF0331/DUF86 family)
VEFINQLDEQLFIGGVILSEWSTFLIRDADTAFTAGAHLAAILTALAGIESHLKYEYGTDQRERLAQLIDAASIADELRAELHALRRYRNRWVHVYDPHEDTDLLSNPEVHEAELEQMATRAL